MVLLSGDLPSKHRFLNQYLDGEVRRHGISLEFLGGLYAFQDLSLLIALFG